MDLKKYKIIRTLIDSPIIWISWSIFWCFYEFLLLFVLAKISLEGLFLHFEMQNKIPAKTKKFSLACLFQLIYVQIMLEGIAYGALLAILVALMNIVKKRFNLSSYLMMVGAFYVIMTIFVLFIGLNENAFNAPLAASISTVSSILTFNQITAILIVPYFAFGIAVWKKARLSSNTEPKERELPQSNA